MPALNFSAQFAEIMIAHLVVYLDSVLIRPAEANEFVRADGFASWNEFEKWFEDHYGLPFDGQVVFWEYPK